MQRFPTTPDLRAAARRRLPNFAFEFADGGAGGSDDNIRRNWAALDAIELVPRYGNLASPPSSPVELFGRVYNAPLGIAPMGAPSVVLPNADGAMASAAQALNVPYVLGLVAGIDVESAARLAPDVLWFQLYRCHRDDHRIGLDLVRRAQAAGVHVLMLTMDTPVRTVRPREVKSGIPTPFHQTMRLRLDALSAPRWLFAMLRHGMPRFANFTAYMPPGSNITEMARFSGHHMGGVFTWEEVGRYRDLWPGPLVLKGVLHPDDVDRAAALGMDGIVVSNHGGRQIEALPAAVDVLPSLVERAGGRLKVMFDSGVRSGVDVARAVALGADLAFAGKAILWSLGALGERGPMHALAVMIQELSAALGQLGCSDVQKLRHVPRRHRDAYGMSDFSRG